MQTQCPHPNACLTCPDFLTTAEHLPAHRDQLTSTLDELIDRARAAGHERLVEQNEQIKLNLLTAWLPAKPGRPEAVAGEALRLLDFGVRCARNYRS